MNLKLYRKEPDLRGKINITGSKSESNRLLILQAKYGNISLRNLSNSEDTALMRAALEKNTGEVDIHHAGTAMRFLTAYYAALPNAQIELTGSTRMQQRPITILVDALRQLGANIEYLNKTGFPPLRIKGKKLTKNKLTLKANVSSQYITALMLIAPGLEAGIELTLIGKITSRPYINMTLSLLRKLGIPVAFEGNIITVSSRNKITDSLITIESDWSSASYFYSIAALSQKTRLQLYSFKNCSLQGDQVLTKIYETHFDVKSRFVDNYLLLEKDSESKKKSLVVLDLSKSPDIAQTIAVTCLGRGVPCKLTGLHTLPIKETDRLAALKNELQRLGAIVNITADSLEMIPPKKIPECRSINTYNDHRMAMAFAPLALKVPIFINNTEVVSKSYPDFWNDLKLLSFRIIEKE